MKKNNKTSEVTLNSLVQRNNTLGMVFFTCLSEDELHEINKKYLFGDNAESPEAKFGAKVPFTLEIGGIPVNPENFFGAFVNQMDQLIIQQARELIKEQVGDNLTDIANKLHHLHEIADSLAEDINWDVENPFTKKK